MADENKVYISAGLTPKKDTGDGVANTVYISAGLSPNVEVAAGGSILLPIMMNMNQFNGGIYEAD